MPVITQLTTGQNNKEVQINENFKAVAFAGSFGLKFSTTSGLTQGMFGGRMVIDGVMTLINDTTLALTASTTNYVSISRAGAFNVNASAHIAGNMPLWELTTDSSGVTSYSDRRPFVMRDFRSRLSKAVTTADVTLTAHELQTDFIITTGTLTGNRSLIVPAQIGEWIVHNTCAGAFTLTVKTPSGSGVIVPAQRKAHLICDGTNVVVAEAYQPFQDIAYAASITPDLSLGSPIIVATLTGDLTVNAPTNIAKGEIIVFNFRQDGTGGWVVTWNAVFKKAADGAGTANQVAATQFLCYDGTNFIQIGGAMSWIT